MYLIEKLSHIKKIKREREGRRGEGERKREKQDRNSQSERK